MAGDVDVPVLSSFLGHDGVPPGLSVPDETGTPGRGSVPSYASPESAALALSRAAAHAAWRARPQGVVPVLPDVDTALASLVAAASPHDGAWLPDSVSAEVLAGVGLEVWPGQRVVGAEQALAAATRLGWPVAVKSSDERWRGRVDVGAVRLGVADRTSCGPPSRRSGSSRGTGELFVQPMAPSGVSVVVRLVQDPAVGPLLSLRLGGTVADLLADPLTRTLPLTDVDAAELVRAVRGAAAAARHRGRARRRHGCARGPAAAGRPARRGRPGGRRGAARPGAGRAGRGGRDAAARGVRLLPPEADPEAGPRRLTGRGAAWLR